MVRTKQRCQTRRECSSCSRTRLCLAPLRSRIAQKPETIRQFFDGFILVHVRTRGRENKKNVLHNTPCHTARFRRLHRCRCSMCRAAMVSRHFELFKTTSSVKDRTIKRKKHGRRRRKCIFVYQRKRCKERLELDLLVGTECCSF